MKLLQYVMCLGLMSPLLLPESQGATVVLSDDFTGLAAATLNGTAVEVGSGVWTASPAFRADGSVNPATLGGSATVPFTPEAGNIYTLSATLNVTVGGNNWFGLGFADGLGTWAGSNPEDIGQARFTGAQLFGYAWMISSVGSGQSAFGGPGTAGGVAEMGSDITGMAPIELSIVLDTSGTDWEASFFRNGSLFGTHVYSSGVPPINSVGLTRQSNSTGTISDFRLTATAVPEPSTALLALLGLIGVAALQKHRHP